MSTSEIVAQQNADGYFWFGLMLAPSFIIYMIAMVGETNRAPFDLPEAEGELVGGFHTEYSILKFALFFLAEYINMVTVSAVATTLFLGGWHAPWPIINIWPGADEGYWPLLWFFGKVFFFVFIFIWLRGSLPRLRYDQFMRFGWKRLIPISLVWILAVATIQRDQEQRRLRHAHPAGRRCRGDRAVPRGQSGGRPDGERGGGARRRGRRRRVRGGFPVPPMPAGGAVRGAAAPLDLRGPGVIGRSLRRELR